MKIVYLLQHCSTGGMPQYTLKQVEETLSQGHEVSVIEVNFYGRDFVVQRERLQKLVDFYPLYGHQEDLPSLLKRQKPDVIHCQELPETFLEEENLKFLYSQDWFTVVTTHGARIGGKDFRYLPDRIITVNRWQTELFQRELPNVDVEMWEYPIIPNAPSQEEKINARKKLGFPNCKGSHILNVGIFTEGKNQGELFEIARKNPQNLYHFVGNQAENFKKSYWGAIMETKPDNCLIWGGREDVDLFYKACDEFYFTSNYELNPICIKEALSYSLPIKMKKLPTYLDDYDNNPLITYIK